MNRSLCRLGIVVALVWGGAPVWAGGPRVGLVLGTPSLGANALVGYNWDPIEVRLSGGVGNEDETSGVRAWGLQADLACNVLDFTHFKGQADLFANYIYVGGSGVSKVAGVGLGGSLWWYGFFLSAGLGLNFAQNDLTELEALAGLFNGDFQIGYVYRFP